MKHILLPVEDVRASARTLPFARALAGFEGATTSLLQVLPVMLDQPLAVVEERLGEARATLETVAKQLGLKGVELRQELRMGDPVDEICKTALLSPDPLLIMASHKRGRLESWFKGSVAEAVLRHTTAPVLVIKDSTEPVDPQQTAHFHKILVPVDGSELAGEILPLVEHLALMFGASVVLYFDDRGGGEADDQPPPEVRPQSHLHRYAEQLREKGINVAMDSSTHESPAKGILACAETHSVDLIAMCTHGYSGIVQGIYGSVAHQVLESANCPLLLQRSRLATENLILEDMFVTG